MTDEEKKANFICKRLAENGWEAYVSGGAVRDLVIGDTPNDFDIVTNASFHDIRRLFKGRKTAVVGASYKICLVDKIEVATYRKRRFGTMDPADETPASLLDDLACRDLTINAMAFSPLTGKIVDPFDGLSDLKNRMIRFTGNPSERIAEDPCRMIRACRFKAKYAGSFEPQTLDALKKDAQIVKKKVAPERIRLEILKAMGVEKPSIFWDALHEIGLLKDILPGFAKAYGLDGGHHHGEEVACHMNLTGDRLSPKNKLLRLTGYLHDYGKPFSAKIKDGRLTFIGHEKLGADLLEKVLTELKFSTKEIDYLKQLTRLHMSDVDPLAPDKSTRKLLNKILGGGLSWKDWMRLKLADLGANMKKQPPSKAEIRGMVMKIHHVLHPEKGTVALSVKDLAIDGKDVMEILSLSPGPAVGQILEKAFEFVLEDPSRNDASTLKTYIEKIAGTR